MWKCGSMHDILYSKKQLSTEDSSHHTYSDRSIEGHCKRVLGNLLRALHLTLR